MFVVGLDMDCVRGIQMLHERTLSTCYDRAAWSNTLEPLTHKVIGPDRVARIERIGCMMRGASNGSNQQSGRAAIFAQ